MVNITFLFGGAIPILFPLAWLALFILYVCERLSMFYSYRKPPVYDTTLTEATIKSLYPATVLCLLVSSWIFSNQQVFVNNAVPLNKKYVYPDS